MKCMRKNDTEISKDVIKKYDLTKPEGRLEYILNEKEGFFPVFSNVIFRIMGGVTEFDKVKEIMFENVEDFLTIEDLDLDKLNKNIDLDLEFLSLGKIYSLDGIFTTLISFIKMNNILKLMRKDKDKLEKAFEKIEKNFVLFVVVLNLKGVKYFSYADPSAMVQILGKYHERWIVERFVDILDKLSHLEVVIHICPTLFNEIKKIPKMQDKKIKIKKVENYQKEFFKEKGFKVIGGSCIKNKNKGIYSVFI